MKNSTFNGRFRLNRILVWRNILSMRWVNNRWGKKAVQRMEDKLLPKNFNKLSIFGRNWRVNDLVVATPIEHIWIMKIEVNEMRYEESGRVCVCYELKSVSWGFSLHLIKNRFRSVLHDTYDAYMHMYSKTIAELKPMQPDASKKLWAVSVLLKQCREFSTDTAFCLFACSLQVSVRLWLQTFSVSFCSLARPLHLYPTFNYCLL